MAALIRRRHFGVPPRPAAFDLPLTVLAEAKSLRATAGSVILAGVLLKMGTYGILRISYPMLPDQAAWFSFTLAVLGCINILYGAYCAMAQSDMKKLVAYSSVSHMGYVLLGMSAMTSAGINGAVLQMFNHYYLGTPLHSQKTIDQLLYAGLFPPIYDRGIEPGIWLGDYIGTYLERDVRQILKVTDLVAFQRFVHRGRETATKDSVGLGLSIVKSLAEGMGGSVGYRREGTNKTVRLLYFLRLGHKEASS